MFQPVPSHAALLARGSLEPSRLWTVEHPFPNQLADQTASLPLLHLLLIDQGGNWDRLLHSPRLALQLGNRPDLPLERGAEARTPARPDDLHIQSTGLHTNAD